jgi:hypothetical protein
MSARQPLSVLMPVRNGADTIEAAISDLLPGLGAEDEFLVVNDGSKDDTETVVALAAAVDPRIRMIRTSGIGLVGALNLGLREASHNWLARADADDRYPANRLPCQRAAVGPDVVLVTGDYRVTFGARDLGEIPCALTSSFVVASLIHPQRVPHPGVLLNREAVQAVGGYQQEDFPAEDLALWLRLAREGTFVGTPTRVVDWSMGIASVSHTRQVSQRQKTSELITSDFPLDLLSSLTEADVEHEVDSYQGTPLEAVRRLLLYRDLRALAGRGVNPRLLRPALRALVGSPGNASRAAWQLWSGKRRRDATRATFKESP